MSNSRRAARIVAEWRRRCEAGAGEPSEELLRGHPEIAEDLRTQLELQQSLGQMADGGPPEPASPRAPLRETIGDFRIVREIGRGGMGVVYEARQESMRRTVALKVLSPTVTLNPKAVERFRREAQAAGSLHHTNIVAVHAMGEDAGIWYYAMERIRGRTLAEVIVDLKRLRGSAPHDPDPETPSSWVTSGGSGRAHYARVASAFAGLADALDHAHAGGILHRDVKPSNVMLDADGTLKLTDFGLARVDDDTAGLTLTGDVLGTPAYMSPEQLRPGTTPLDGRTDVYSLGATLYEFLALRSPFEAGSPRELLSGILTKHAESTRRSNPRIPRDLDTIVLKALERDPAKRYRTAGEMGHDLLRFAEGVPIQARRASSVVRLWRRVRKHRRTVASIGTVAVAGAVVFWALASNRAERERRIDLEYDKAVHQAMASMLERGWFAEGRLWRLPPQYNEDLLATLKRLADAHPRRNEARLLAVLLPETPLERQLADLDAGRSAGLDERAWRLARAYAFFRASRFGEGIEEHAAAGLTSPTQDRLTELLNCYALACEGNRVEAIAGLDRLLDGESTFHHALALEARAFGREQQGDVTGALEDYSALETHVGDFRLAIRVRMAGLWLGLEQDEKVKAIFDEGLAAVRKNHGGDANRFGQLVDGCWPWMPVEWHDRATRAAIEDLPDSSPAWALRAASLSRRKNADRAGAVDAGQRALVGASGPARKALLVDLAEMLLGAGRAPEALESCEQALAIDASSSSALASKVWILWALGQKEESLALARRTAQREPSHLPLRALAYTLARSNQIEEALATCARALKAEPRSADCHLLKINILRNLRRWDEVETACRAALARNGNNIIVLHRLCEAYDSLNRWVDYLSIAQRLTKLEPEVSRNWANLANALSELDRPADALPAIRHAMEVGPPHVNHYRVAATVLHQLRRTDEAVLELEKCIANGDATPSVWREAAQMLLSVNRPKEALALADRGLVRFETDVFILHQRAVALYELGEKEQALKAFRRELKLDPTQSQAWSNAALCEDELGRTETALATVREGLAKTGAKNVRSMLGAILLEHDRTAEAREALAPLCAVPQDANSMAQHVSALAAVGTLDEAIACVEGVRGQVGVAEGARWAKPVVVGWRGKRKREADAEALAQRVSQWPGLDGYEGAYLMAIGGMKIESARLAASLPPPADAAQAYDRARLYALLGRREDALAGLNHVVREGRKAPVAAEDPDLAAYREDPEFLAVFERLR